MVIARNYNVAVCYGGRVRDHQIVPVKPRRIIHRSNYPGPPQSTLDSMAVAAKCRMRSYSASVRSPLHLLTEMQAGQNVILENICRRKSESCRTREPIIQAT